MCLKGGLQSMENTIIIDEIHYKISDLLDLETFQPLLENFYAATDIPCGIGDVKGNCLVVGGWEDICSKFHRNNPITLNRCIESS